MNPKSDQLAVKAKHESQKASLVAYKEALISFRVKAEKEEGMPGFNQKA